MYTIGEVFEANVKAEIEALVAEVVGLCKACKCADDVEHIWRVANAFHKYRREDAEEAFFNLYDWICDLEDHYNDGRWA